MEPLFDYIKGYAHLSEEEVKVIESWIYIEKFKAKSIVHRPGNICKRIGFVKKGVLRSYFYDQNGEEIIKGFLVENQFAVDLHSYQNNTASKQYIQALTDSELIFIPKSSDEYFAKNIRTWLVLVRQISDAVLYKKIEKKTLLFHENAKERYLSFMRENPKLIHTVPLGQIASFLGIAQQSLSRIRKELTT